MKINLSKESFKFSSAHITFFPNGEQERLHGHNYQVSVTIGICEQTFENLISFSVFKSEIKALCDSWDEFVLLPTKCPSLKVIIKSKRETEVLAGKKRYVFPSEDIVWIDVDNITSENLAMKMGELLLKRYEKSKVLPHIRTFAIKVSETRGQGATWSWKHV